MREILFKDVAHLYKNLLVHIKDGGICRLNYVSQNLASVSDPNAIDVGMYLDINEITPIFLPLSSLTKEQAIELCSIHSAAPFSGHRLKRWELSPLSEQLFFRLTNERNIHAFTIDATNGDVMAYMDDELEATDNTGIMTFYLTSQYFDLFNLIKTGQAIDATTLPVNPYKG